LFLTDKELVSLKTFNTTIGLFGKFYEKATAAGVVEQTKAIRNAPWFWGIYTSDQAGSLLSQKDEGTYLIRVSVTRGPQFALSFSKGKGKAVQHYLINKVGSDFVCGDYKSNKLPELVDELVEVFGLILPCVPETTASEMYSCGPSKENHTG